MAQALRLTFVNRAFIYEEPYARIFGDTIVGYHVAFGENDSNYYFIQSLKNIRFFKRIVIDSIIFPSVSVINDYRDGCAFSPGFGQSYVEKVCKTGLYKKYFKRTQSGLFYVNKTKIYKDKSVIVSMNGIYIFDLKSEKLLWKYRFKNDTELSLSALINNKFIFTENPRLNLDTGGLAVHCIDLDKLIFKWHRTFAKQHSSYVSYYQYQEHDLLYHSKYFVCIPSFQNLYVLDFNTGKVLQRFSKKEYGGYVPDNRNLIINTSLGMTSIAINSGKRNWLVNKVFVEGTFKQSVIGTSIDRKRYIIVDKKSGMRIKDIVNPDSKDFSVSFLNDYIIIERNAIYK